MRTTDTRLLAVFVAVARHRGITAAADALGAPKSAISKQLSALETFLGLRLFERSSRHLALTRTGQVLLPRAESILAELDLWAEEARQTHAQVRGGIRLAASPEFGALLAERFLPALLRRHPALKVSMALHYERDDLQDPAFDLAFRLGDIGDDRLVARHLGDFSRVLVCSPGYLLAHPVQAPEDIQRVDALTFTDAEEGEDWVLESATPEPLRCLLKVNGRLSIRGFTALAGAAMAGMGVARLPNFVAAPHVAEGRLVRILDTWRSPVPVYLAYRPGMSRVGRVRAVIEAAMEVVPDLLA